MLLEPIIIAIINLINLQNYLLNSSSRFIYNFVFQLISENILCSKDFTRNLIEIFK